MSTGEVHIRPALPEDYAAAVELWDASLDAPRERIVDDLAFEPEWHRHSFVAADGAGSLHAALFGVVRSLRGADGAPQRVGGLSALATAPTARGRGYGSRLVERWAAAMAADGCRWGLLSTEVSGFYERLGWRVMRTRYRQGVLADPPPPPARPVRALGPAIEGSLEALAAVYAAYNGRRPLTTVRDLDYWRRHTAPRLAAPGTTVLVAAAAGGAGIAGYARAHFGAETFGITEIGALPGSEGLIGDLIVAAASEAARRGIRLGRVYLPFEPAVDAALGAIYAGMEQGEHAVFMTRPLAPDVTPAAIQAIYDGPGAIPWPADDF